MLEFLLQLIKGQELLFRLIFPAIWKVYSGLRTSRAEMGQISIFGFLFRVMSKAKPFAGPKVTPLS
jgi:hypothetical protein